MHDVEAHESGEGLGPWDCFLGVMGGAQDEEGDQGDVDLDFHGVFADAEEVFDFEVLLDPFEEQLDLPALFVERGDLFGRGLEVVGDEPQGFVPIDADRDLAHRIGC